MTENDQQHIDAICLRNDIEQMSRAQAELTGGYDSTENHSFATYGFGRLHGVKKVWLNPDIYDEDDHSYMAALHEIGHIMNRHQRPNSFAERDQMEIEAWEWAFDHAQHWPNDETIVEILLDLSTYTHLEDAINRGEAKRIDP